MTQRNDGPWDAPTEHDQNDSAEFSGEDPPTMRANEQQRARARGAAIANQLATATSVPDPMPPSVTLPPPVAQRQPAKPAQLATGSEDNPVVLLDRVSGNASTAHAPRRSESAAGGVVVVATGADGERVRKLCHNHGLLVPVMASLAAVHEAMSVVVIGEPSPPAPERVVHVARPSLSDDQLLDLLRALVSGRAVVEPPQPPAAGASDAKVAEAARRLASLTDRGAIEMITIEAITVLTAADRAHCLFHDPSTGALWSEARKRDGRDDRQAMGGFVGWAAQTGQTIHASPASDDPRWLQEIDDPDGKPQSRLLVQPIIGADRRVHAVLVAIRRWRHADFSEREKQALASFAALAGPALDIAIAASPPEPRAPRTTKEGPLGAAMLPLPAAPAGLRFAPAVRPEESTRVDDAPGADSADGRGSAAKLDGRQSSANLDGRHSAESITGLPSPPILPSRPSVAPPVPPATVADDYAEPTRTRTANDSQQPAPMGLANEPRDLAVIASADDVKRVQRIARKGRLEVSTFALLAEAPTFYQVVTIGEAWSPGSDHRVSYAARSAVSDEQLADLFKALTTGRAVVSAPPLLRPQSGAEARRSHRAFVAARKLAGTTDLEVAEQIATKTVRELLDSDRAYCLFVDPDTGALWSEARRRGSGDDRRAIAGIAGWAARTGRAVSAPHASTDPRYLGAIDDPDGDQHSQLLVQPLVRADKRVHGVLIAARRARRPGFTDTDTALLSRFAALAAPLFEQLVIYLDTQQLIENSSTQSPLTADPVLADDEPVSAETEAPLVVRDAHPFTRWIFLAIGTIVGLIIGLLVSSVR